jgi:hypothetical protein
MSAASAEQNLSLVQANSKVLVISSEMTKRGRLRLRFELRRQGATSSAGGAR